MQAGCKASSATISLFSDDANKGDRDPPSGDECGAASFCTYMWTVKKAVPAHVNAGRYDANK